MSDKLQSTGSTMVLVVPVLGPAVGVGSMWRRHAAPAGIAGAWSLAAMV